MVLRLAASGADVDLYICTLLPLAASRAIFVATLAAEVGINSCLLPSVEFHHTHVLNIIIYLSENWNSSFGGNTLLFNKKGRKVEKIIEFVPNRLLIFLHTPYSFHGVDSLKPNLKQVRKTLYLDFYSDLDDPYKHLSLPFKNHFFNHGATFVLKNKLSYLKPLNFYYTKALLKYKINQYI